MDRSLNSLNPKFYPLAIELLARLTEAGILVMISNTGRTAAEQAAEVAAGNSWVAYSLHEDGLAIDVVPYLIWNEHGGNKLQWDTGDPIWIKIGAIGAKVKIGNATLRWGGTFTPLNSIGVGKDPGHFEYHVELVESPTSTI